MDAYEDLIDIKKESRDESNRSLMPFFFIKPNESYNINYNLVQEENGGKEFTLPKFPFPKDFNNYESFSKETQNWMDATLKFFLQSSKAPLLPVSTTLFYRTFNLDFWPHDKNTLRLLAKKLGPLLLPLRPKNLLELQDKIFNSPTNITSLKYNSSNDEIFKNENNFSEPDYNGRPLPYKYHFTQNNFFQLIPPEPLPDYYDSFEQYNSALKNWYNITNKKYPGYKKIKKVEELGKELGIKPVVSNPSISSFSGRNKIEKMNEENRQNLFYKDSKHCTINQLNKAFNVSLSKEQFNRLTSLNTQMFESTLHSLLNKCVDQPSDSMSKISMTYFDEESLELLNESNYEEVSFIIDELIEYGPTDYILKSPIKNYDILSQMIFVEPSRQMSIAVIQRPEPTYLDFPLILLNNETPDQFTQYCDEKNIDFSSFINTSEEFINFIKLCDPNDRTLSQKFVYVFKNLFSSPTKFEIYLKPLIGHYDPKDCFSFDMSCHSLLKKFLKIVEGASEFDDEKIPRMMYNLNIKIDEDSYVNPKKKSSKNDNDSSKTRDFNRKEILNIYKLTARCASLYTFTNLFSFKKWNSNIIFEYISMNYLNPLLYQLSKRIQMSKNEIVSCYISDTISKFDRDLKKANGNAPKNVIDDEDANIGSKLISFSSAFLSFADASKSLSEQFVIPIRKNQLRIPIFVLNQDGSSGSKVSTIDDSKMNDTQDKTLSALSSNLKVNSPQPSKSLKNRPSLIENEKIDKNLSPLNPNSKGSNYDESLNIDNIIKSIDSNDAEYPNRIIANGKENDEVEDTINSIQHSISAMKSSFKSLPKIDIENDDNDDDDNDDDNDDYMKIFNKQNTKSSPSESKKSSSKKKKKKKKKSKSSKNLAYRIIFLIINIDYPNLHNALFCPSPINFFNEISKLENDNAFMNLAGGFYNKTEKLKSSFLCSDAFRNLEEMMINFDVQKLDLTNVNFARRALLILNRCDSRLFSRSQITSLLKTFTANVSRFNFALCPVLALHLKNRDKFIYTTTIKNDSKSGTGNNNSGGNASGSMSNGGSLSGRSSASNSILSSIENNFAGIDMNKKPQRKPPIMSAFNENSVEFDPSSVTNSVSPSSPAFSRQIPSSEPLASTDRISPLRSSFRLKKDKNRSSNHKKSTFDDSIIAEYASTSSIDQFESKAKSFDPHAGPISAGATSGLLISSSLSTAGGFQKREQLMQRRLSGRRRNADSIFGLGGIRVSLSGSSMSDSENSALNLSSINSGSGSNASFGSLGDSFLLSKEESQQPLKPQYAGDEWMSDTTMIASYLASLVYSVNSACFPYLLRSVDLLFCSPKINFPRKFWGTFCGALSVAEINAWIFLRTIFRNGYVQVLPPEFTFFFPAVFNYKSPYIQSSSSDKEDQKGNNNSPSTVKSHSNSNSSGNCLTFENLNNQVEKAKQLSLKVSMFAAIVTSSVDISLQYLEALMMNDRSHLQKIFSKSVNPSLKIEKLSHVKNQSNGLVSGSEVKSSININLYSSSYKASLSNIVQKNFISYRKIVDKLKSYGNKFQNLISMFPVS